MHQKNVSLKNFNTFKIDKIAKNFFIANNINDLEKYTTMCPNAYILGMGSNILILNDVDAVIKLGDSFAASKPLSYYCSKFLKQELSGFEPLVGIPGSLGGAIKINAGGKYGSIGNLIDFVVVFDKEIKIVHPVFEYRNSNITGIILDCKFKNLKQSNYATIHNAMQSIMEEKQNTQPLDKLTAGCIFKNPDHISAAKLIESCNIDIKSDTVKISKKHHNFLEVSENTDPYDILQAIQLIQEEVKHQQKICLELEIDIWQCII